MWCRLKHLGTLSRSRASKFGLCWSPSALPGHSLSPSSLNQPRGMAEPRAGLAECWSSGAQQFVQGFFKPHLSAGNLCWEPPASRTTRWVNFCSVMLSFCYGIKNLFKSKPFLLYPNTPWRGRKGFLTGRPRCCTVAMSTRWCLWPCSGPSALEMFACHVAVPFYLQVWLYKCSCLKDTRQGINLWAHRLFEHRQPQHLTGNKESWSGSFLMKSWQHIRGAAWPRDVSKDATMGV